MCSEPINTSLHVLFAICDHIVVFHFIVVIITFFTAADVVLSLINDIRDAPLVVTVVARLSVNRRFLVLGNGLRKNIQNVDRSDQGSSHRFYQEN